MSTSAAIESCPSGTLARRDATTVLIVGAGPTGLTLACELARRGIPFRLIEASAGPQQGSRGKGVQPRTLEVFDDLGVVDSLIANGRMGMPIVTNGGDGAAHRERKDSVERTQGSDPGVPYPTTLITPQWQTEAVLRNRLKALGGEVEFGVVLDHFTQSNSEVTAVLGKDGEAQTVSAQWLVGCDGGHSQVRKQTGIGFSGDTLESVRMIVADVEVEGGDRTAWQMWRHEEGFASLCPLPSTNLFQFQAGISPAQNPELSLANMQLILDRRSGHSDFRLSRLEWSSLWRANIRLADRYRDGRVFLAGDAAHIHSPAGGQGMNTGIQDAQNLAWKLAAVATGAPSELLDTYEAERRPVAAHVLALSNERLRQAIEQKAIPVNRNASTMQLDIRYRDSVLSCDTRHTKSGLNAGERAPDATGLLTSEGECRLFDLTRGPHFTLLCFGGAAPDVSDSTGLRAFRIVRQLTEPSDVVDSKGDLARAYEAKEGSLVLIRPDGYIGLLCDDDMPAVSRYLATLGRGVV